MNVDRRHLWLPKSVRPSNWKTEPWQNRFPSLPPNRHRYGNIAATLTDNPIGSRNWFDTDTLDAENGTAW